jgi:anti-sigma factor ChrR (cupin superfamily)
MSKDDRAAEYVLGVLPAAERDAVERAAAADPALAEEIEAWNEQLSPLLLDAPEVEPPADMFDRIKAAIAASSKPPAVTNSAAANSNLAGSRTVRADEGKWEPLCSGVERKVLFFDRARKRITFLIRAQAGAAFPAHHHDDDEEAYVLSGDLSFDDLVLGAGDYHLARPGVSHPVGRTRGGCMLLMTAAA